MRKDRESWLSKLRKYVTKRGGGGGGDQEEEEELSFLYYFRKIFRVSCSVSMAPSPKLALPYYVYRNRDAIASYIIYSQERYPVVCSNARCTWMATAMITFKMPTTFFPRYIITLKNYIIFPSLVFYLHILIEMIRSSIRLLYTRMINEKR